MNFWKTFLEFFTKHSLDTRKSFKDKRDGKVYKTETIGLQTWLAENLSYKAKEGCWAYDNDVTNVAKYGYLYDWDTAKVVCPKGWHLPTDAEWSILIDYLGGKDIAGDKLKSMSGWQSNIGANNLSGFTALPGGYRSEDGSFDYIDEGGSWWSSSEYHSLVAWARELGYNHSFAYRIDNYKVYGFSVRCIKNN